MGIQLYVPPDRKRHTVQRPIVVQETPIIIPPWHRREGYFKNANMTVTSFYKKLIPGRPATTQGLGGDGPTVNGFIASSGRVTSSECSLFSVIGSITTPNVLFKTCSGSWIVCFVMEWRLPKNASQPNTNSQHTLNRACRTRAARLPRLHKAGPQMALHSRGPKVAPPTFNGQANRCRWELRSSPTLCMAKFYTKRSMCYETQLHPQ